MNLWTTRYIMCCRGFNFRVFKSINIRRRLFIFCNKGKSNRRDGMTFRFYVVTLCMYYVVVKHVRTMHIVWYYNILLQNYVHLYRVISTGYYCLQELFRCKIIVNTEQRILWIPRSTEHKTYWIRNKLCL